MITKISEKVIINLKVSRSGFLNERRPTHPSKVLSILYSETLNNEYIERIHQMSYSSPSDNGMLQIFSFLMK